MVTVTAFTCAAGRGICSNLPAATATELQFSRDNVIAFQPRGLASTREWIQIDRAEAADYEKRELESRDKDRRDGQAIPAGQSSDVERAYNQFWWDRPAKGTGNRTGLIVSPASGRLPDLTPEAKEREKQEATQPAYRSLGSGGRGNSYWGDRSLWERCLTQGSTRLGAAKASRAGPSPCSNGPDRRISARDHARPPGTLGRCCASVTPLRASSSSSSRATSATEPAASIPSDDSTATRRG